MASSTTFACTQSIKPTRSNSASLERRHERKASSLSAKAHHAHSACLRWTSPKKRSEVIGGIRAVLEERSRTETFDIDVPLMENMKEECQGVCCINKGPFGERRVPIYDSQHQTTIMADIIGRPDPNHVGFSSGATQLWTLDLRLASNGTKIGDLVVRVSPSSDVHRVDLTVRTSALPPSHDGRVHYSCMSGCGLFEAAMCGQKRELFCS